ncbi:MAG: efflux RND transporter periplasmic adaptor subunit [Acidobacteriota bacterium]|nr:efflux RND transporter periplasmic adaptor subunit [Acidobacteriota bacterium]
MLKVKSSESLIGGAKRWSAVRFILFAALLSAYCLPLIVLAHGGVDDEKPAAAPQSKATGASVITIARAERNIQTDAGQFNARLERAPADVRTGETSEFAVRLAEKVEGGFGAGEPVAIEDATVTANITTAEGQAVASNLPMKFEKGFYRGSYSFSNPGNYKIVFNAATSDNRSFSVDFPLSVVKAPVSWTFWLGFLFLSLLTFGTIAAVFIKTRGATEEGEEGAAGNRQRARRIAPVAAAALVILALGTFALAVFAPPRQTRSLAAMPPLGTSTEAAPAPEAANALQTNLTIPKESQVLFGIKTEPVSVRQITSGLKTSGIVRARPDAQAVVVPPVAGRIALRAGLTIGSAVGRGEQIGSVEQILDVAGQVGLETQRLDVAGQQRDVEAKRLELRNTALALQGQQAQQRAAASQSRTRLAQANRELRRSENLVEVGAVPRKRVEEALTAVKVAEQEVAAADKQVTLLDTQIKAAQAGQAIFRAPQVNQPTRVFPLTAPVTGIVNEIKATSGQQVETATQILSISNLSTVLIEAQVFEKDLPLVRQSTRASFTASALSGEVYNIGTNDGDGRLASIGQTVDPQTRTVPVIYEVKNPLGRLREGNFIEITIDTSGDAKVIAVPKQAVINEQGQTFVFVFTGGESFEKRPVALGAEGADFYEVKSGLKEGDRIVTEGVYQLRTTQPTA